MLYTNKLRFRLSRCDSLISENRRTHERHCMVPFKKSNNGGMSDMVRRRICYEEKRNFVRVLERQNLCL